MLARRTNGAALRCLRDSGTPLRTAPAAAERDQQSAGGKEENGAPGGDPDSGSGIHTRRREDSSGDDLLAADAKNDLRICGSECIVSSRRCAGDKNHTDTVCSVESPEIEMYTPEVVSRERLCDRSASPGFEHIEAQSMRRRESWPCCRRYRKDGVARVTRRRRAVARFNGMPWGGCDSADRAIGVRAHGSRQHSDGDQSDPHRHGGDGDRPTPDSDHRCAAALA